MQLDPKDRFAIIDAYNHPAFQQEREAFEATLKEKEETMKQVTKKTDISIKSRHFAHRGPSLQSIKPTDSSNELKTQAIQDTKPNLHGSLPFARDFSDEKKLVMQQMASKEKQKDASLDNATVANSTVENKIAEKTESSSAASNAELPPSSVKPAVYSCAEIKPRNSTLQGASVNPPRTGPQTEERTIVTQSEKSGVVEEDSKAKAKPTVSSHTSHLVTANYSFFPVNEESEVDYTKNVKVLQSQVICVTSVGGI